MPTALQEQVAPDIELIGAVPRTLLISQADSTDLVLPGDVTTMVPDQLHLHAPREAFDLVVLLLSEQLDTITRLELPSLVRDAMSSGAFLIQSARRGAYVEFPLLRVKFSVPPDGTDLMLSIYRRVA